ncbi:MAG: threonine-phosphate decarboxylase, partial [Desulfovibrionaceae bacterium]|nr:threonine-phosphate decarboxylase [Desulfovibrionaceae bacterium]
IPGSKNTVADMRLLRGAGMAAAIRSLPESVRVVGICAGFQMLGQEIDDPLGLESRFRKRIGAFGILPVATTLMAEKTLKRSLGRHLESGLAVSGYEIHHGRTTALGQDIEVAVADHDGQPLGFGLKGGRVWGTYLHGIFDDDAFRRWFVDDLRTRKGLAPLGRAQTAFDIEPALDHLASVVRDSLDMAAVYRAAGFRATRQATFFKL